MTETIDIELLKVKQANRWNTLLDELKVREEIASDSDLAKTLKVSRSFISAIRKCKRDLPENLAEDLLNRLDRPLNMQEAILFLPKLIIEKTTFKFATVQANKDLLIQSKHLCDLCGKPAPFNTSDGEPYLEVYCFTMDLPTGHELGESALCPNCHQKMIHCNTEKNRIKLQEKVINNIFSDLRNLDPKDFYDLV